MFATRNAFLFGRPPGRSRATSWLDGRKVPIIIVKRQARILLPCWGDSDRASRHPSVAASTESNGHEWARPRRRPSPPRDPPAQASAVHLRVLRGALLVSNLKDEYPANITMRPNSFRGVNAITAGGWAVEVAWLEIECVSIAGLGKGGRDYTTSLEIFKLD